MAVYAIPFGMGHHGAMEPLAYYRWLFAEGIHTEGVGLTWCTGIGVDEVIARIGGSVASGEEMTVRQAYGRFDDRPVLVGQADEAVLIAEPWSGFGAMPEMVKRLSQSGAQAVNVFWNVEWDNSLTVGRDGEVLLRFDMVNREKRTAPDQFASVLEGFPWGSEPDDWKAAGLRVAEEVSGSRLPADWPDVR